MPFETMKNLYQAIEEGDEKALKNLVKAGADVNAVGGQYGSARQAADKEIVEILIRAGADVGVADGIYEVLFKQQ